MTGFVACGPNEAIIVSGCCYSHPRMVAGGRVFVWPKIQIVHRISLNTMTLFIETPRVFTGFGIPVSVTGIAQVKIQGQNLDMLRKACEQFLGKSPKEIMTAISETIEGHQRSVIASSSVEEIYKNRKKFSKRVFEAASSDLIDMGFEVISFTVKDISDDYGYLKALGQARTAVVKSDARKGEAEARRNTTIEEAKANEERISAQYHNETEVARAKRSFESNKAIYNREVFTKKAESDLAYKLQAAKVRQVIIDEQINIKLVEKQQEIHLQEQEVLRKKNELEASIMKTVEAERYKIEKVAEAMRKKVIAEAEGKAEAMKLKGEAESEAIEMKAKAETEQMARKADAYKTYDDAAKIEMVLAALPRFAAECAAPLAQVEKLGLISIGNGPVGASRLVGEILEIMQNTYLAVLRMGQENYAEQRTQAK